VSPGGRIDDAELITAAAAGDAQALDQLVERYGPQVYRFAMRVCRNQEDAQEILQDTFLNAIRAPDQTWQRPVEGGGGHAPHVP